jgi:hypothetical protein
VLPEPPPVSRLRGIATVRHETRNKARASVYKPVTDSARASSRTPNDPMAIVLKGMRERDMLE